MLPSRKLQQNWLPAFFNDFFDFDGFGRIGNVNSPAINVIENDKEYRVEIAAPGMSKEDFKIKINEDNQLVISLEHKVEKEDKGKEKDEKYLRREFSYSHCEQTLLLPDNIKKEDINAKMNHGVLRIYLPKITEIPTLPEDRFIDIQ